MMPRVFRLNWLFLVVALVAVATSVWQYVSYTQSPSGRYIRHGDGYALMSVLTLELKNGEAYATVIKKLGEGRELTSADELADARAAVLENERDNTTFCPDGLKDSDRFLQYQFEQGGAIRLQFRDGYLVNHVVSDQTAKFFRAQLER